MNWILSVAMIGCLSGCLAASLRPHQQASGNSPVRSLPVEQLPFKSRQRRDAFNTIDDCMTVTSKGGHFYYKADPKGVIVPGMTCALFLITDPDRQIEIEIAHIDVPCEEGGEISVVDGWAMGGEFFPSAEDHPLPLEQRVVTECGSRQLNSRYLSSQNAALVQYRVPNYDQGFSLRVRYIKNPQPCNILVEGTSDVYTLSNYGRRINCSVTALSPASVSLVSLDVGSAGIMTGHSRSQLGAHHSAAGGVMHKCQDKGMSDYLQIGGSAGLDTANLLVADSVCGLARDSKSSERTIACGISTVRLVSSGHHHNVAQVAIRPATDEEVFSADFMCMS